MRGEGFWGSVYAFGDCWLWTGYIDPEGYGQGKDTNDKTWRAHRLAWTLLVGPIPNGLTTDHLCRVRNCVNPDHIELVPPGVNTLRGYGRGAQNARKTECKRGHPLNGENLYTYSDGRRLCRTCNAASSRRSYLRQKQERNP